jgi:uncharacterized protein YndB with AHSA1/START domain
MDHTQSDRQHVLKISRIIHAPRQEVFEAWTTAESVKQWMCPEGSSVSFGEKHSSTMREKILAAQNMRE